MITKLCIVCLCIVVCSMFGLKLNKDSTDRVRYYESLIALIDRLIAEIQFRQGSLGSVLSGFIESNKSSLNNTLKDFLAHMEDESVPFRPSRQRLKAEETEEVAKFLSSLGTSDSDTQLFELNNYKAKFEGKRLLYAEKHRKYGSLYLKLSFLLGLAIGIVII